MYKRQPATLAAVEKAWSKMHPDQLYEYTFLDEHIASFYETEALMLKPVSYTHLDVYKRQNITVLTRTNVSDYGQIIILKQKHILLIINILNIQQVAGKLFAQQK